MTSLYISNDSTNESLTTEGQISCLCSVLRRAGTDLDWTWQPDTVTQGLLHAHYSDLENGSLGEGSEGETRGSHPLVRPQET